MKTFISRVLIVAFTCNILLPNPAVFAQPVPKGNDVLVAPWNKAIQTPTAGQLPATTDIYGQKQEEYNAQSDQRRIKRGLDKSDAQINQFLANGDKNSLVDFLTKNELPKDGIQLGMQEYVPGLFFTHQSQESAKAALGSLNKLYNDGQVDLADLTALLGAPSPQIASWATDILQAEFSVQDNTDLETFYLLLSLTPDVQKAALKRLNALEQQPLSERDGLPGFSLLKKVAGKQVESQESVALRGKLELLLAGLAANYQTVLQQQWFKPLLQYENILKGAAGEDGANYTVLNDSFQPSFYAQRKEALLKSMDYWRTLKEVVDNEPNAARLMNADYASVALMKYDGVAGFRKVIDFLDSQNKNLNGTKQQNNLDPANFAILNTVFNNFAALYLPLIESRDTALPAKQKNEIINALAHYANHGSAAVQVLALSLLSKMYEAAGPKWTRGKGNDKGAKGGPALNKNQANQVADKLKDFYCRLDMAADRPVLNLNADKNLEMRTQLAQAYNRIRRDAQGNVVNAQAPNAEPYITHNGKRYYMKLILQAAPIEGGKQHASGGWYWATRDNKILRKLNPQEAKAAADYKRWGKCYVRTGAEPQKLGLAASENKDDLMWFILSWVAIGGVFNVIGKGVSATGNALRLANQARKVPMGQRLAYIRSFTQQARQANKLSKELSQMGVRVERVAQRADGSTIVTNALKDVNPKGITQGYKITQRFPGGKTVTHKIAGEVVVRPAAAAGKLPVKANAKETISSVTDLVDKYVTKIPQGVSKQAYQEALATENLFKAGLEELTKGAKEAPIWIDFSNTSYVPTNYLGVPYTKPVRLDVLEAMSNPGTVLNAALSKPGEYVLKYVKNIGTAMGGFAVADVALHPVQDMLDGKYQSAPEGSPWYYGPVNYWNNMVSPLLTKGGYAETMGSSIILPFSLMNKGVQASWDAITQSAPLTAKEAQQQVEQNPYIQKYKKEADKRQAEFDEDMNRLIVAWQESQRNPDDMSAANEYFALVSQYEGKYANNTQNSFNQKWAFVTRCLAEGINPYDYQKQVDENGVAQDAWLQFGN